MAQKRLSRTQFLERLLSIMDRKHHWAWPIIMGPGISKAQLKLHYQQEFLVYVRDFPVLLARVHGQNPPPDVRRMLAENIYEEDTGGLSFGRSHPELFNEMMQGLGFRNEVFRTAKLLPASARYRKWLEQVTASRDWVVGAAALAVFVEGSIKDRQEIQEPSKPKSEAEIEAYINAHPSSGTTTLPGSPWTSSVPINRWRQGTARMPMPWWSAMPIPDADRMPSLPVCHKD